MSALMDEINLLKEEVEILNRQLREQDKLMTSLEEKVFFLTKYIRRLEGQDE